jgi:hypothetical protein
MLRKQTAGLLAAALVCPVLGCSAGDEKASRKVYGAVTYDGRPVPVGTVTFHFESGKVEDGGEKKAGARLPPVWLTGEAVSVEIEDGRYTVGKVGEGLVTVTVSTATHRTRWKLLAQKGNARNPEEEREWARLKDMVDVPPKYAAPKTSSFRCEILRVTFKPGEQEIDIDLPKE